VVGRNVAQVALEEFLDIAEHADYRVKDRIDCKMV